MIDSELSALRELNETQDRIAVEVQRLIKENAALSDQVERARYEIPILTGCCLACGDRLDITQGPVNDVTCVRVRPHCACNQGVHLWQSLAARASGSSDRE